MGPRPDALRAATARHAAPRGRPSDDRSPRSGRDDDLDADSTAAVGAGGDAARAECRAGRPATRPLPATRPPPRLGHRRVLLGDRVRRRGAVVLRDRDARTRAAADPVGHRLAGAAHRPRAHRHPARAARATLLTADGGASGGARRAAAARLDLADWRRRVSELYAEVRALAGVD